MYTTKLRTVDLVGAHVGGDTITSCFLGTKPLPQLDVQIIDQQAGRPEALAKVWTEAGHQAIGRTGDARIVRARSGGDLIALATDDPTVQVQLLQRSQARMITIGLMLASKGASDGSGFVLGYAAVVPEHDQQMRADAVTLFSCIQQVTGGQRLSSQAVSSPIWNVAKLPGVRTAIYQNLSTVASKFLWEGEMTGQLLVACALPAPTAYPLVLEERNGRSRRQMCDAAARRGKSVACAYVDQSRPDWLYTVLPTRYGRGIPVEFPTPMLPARQLPEPRPSGTD